MEAFQVVITVVSILLTGYLLTRQLRRASRRIRLRPRLDVIRIVVQFTSVILVAVLLGAGAPILALALVGLLAVGPGYVQGRNLEISDDDGRLYAVRNTVAASVWGVGLVIMQVAGLLRRTGILGFGQATAWIGVGLAVGLVIGRHGPLDEYRRTAGRVAIPVAGAIVVVLAAVTLADGRQAGAQDSGRWTQVDVQINPNGDPAPDRWGVAMGVDSLTVVESFGPDDPGGGEATFEATWEAPAAMLTPGEPLVIPVTVSGRNTGNLDTQYFFGLDVIMIVNGRWNNQAVGAGANCAQTTVISGVYVCSDPVTNTGEMVTTVPTSGDVFTIGVGALNCGGACYVEWSYEFEAGDSPLDPAIAGTGTQGNETPGGSVTPGTADNADAAADQPDDDVGALEDFIEQQREDTGIEPDEAMQAAIAGVIAALATGGISLIEAMDQVAQIFEEGSTIERTPKLPDPVEVDTGNSGEMVTDDQPPDLESAPRSGSGFEDDLATYISNLPPPGPGLDIDDVLDTLQGLIEAGAQQGEHWHRPFDVAEIGRVWDALGGVASDPSAATADELRNAMADLLDRDVGGMPVWLVSWAARNPVAAGEMIVRIAAAIATEGASELVLIPWDVNRDITSARDAAIRRGEPFGFGDAVLAGAQGQVIGWVVDGGGAAINAQRRAAGETLAEIAARTEARAAAEGLGEAGETLAETAARTEARAAGESIDEVTGSLGRRAPDADELIDASRRNTDPDAWRGMDNEPPGSKIPPEHIRETGYTPEQARELQRVAAEQNVIIGTRETNLDSTRWIEAGEAIPKPMEVKAKTVNELDALIGGPPADRKGLVGFFEPTEPPMPRDANPALWERFDARRAEWDKLKDEMAIMESAGYQVRDGVVSKVMPDGSVVPFAGDIDAVALLDARTGQPLSGARYHDVVAELRQSGAMLQHGAETNVVNDIVSHETAGLVPGTREYNEAFDRALDKATALADKLDQNHLQGREQVFWTHARGHYRGPQMRRLADWQAMTARSMPTRITDPVELAAAIRPVTRAIADDQ